MKTENRENKNLNQRWEDFDTEKFAEAVFTGKGTKTIDEAKGLMDETIEARDEKTQNWTEK